MPPSVPSPGPAGFRAALWVGFFLLIGFRFGRLFEVFLRQHRGSYWIFLPGGLALLLLYLAAHRRRASAGD